MPGGRTDQLLGAAMRSASFDQFLEFTAGRNGTVSAGRHCGGRTLRRSAGSSIAKPANFAGDRIQSLPNTMLVVDTNGFQVPNHARLTGFGLVPIREPSAEMGTGTFCCADSAK